jgi:hypothetical protein
MTSWWGNFNIGREGSVKKQIGPLSLVIMNEIGEWKIYYDRSMEWSENRGEEEARILEKFEVYPDTLKERYVLSESPQYVHLSPVLADRSVVVQPEKPFYIPTQQNTTLFISSPLWVKLSYDAGVSVLTEIPIVRPSDTWFGPNTMDGESCYASKTSARMSLKDLPRRFHRAITPLQIYNDSESHLLLERINLPVSCLDLYESADEQLWTQEIKMVKDKNEVTAGLEILPGPPQYTPEARRLSEAREKMDENTIIRKISGFFA